MPPGLRTAPGAEKTCLLFLNPHRAQRVQRREQRHADVGKDGLPHVRRAERAEDEEERLDRQREDDVLVHDAQRARREMRMACAILAGSSSISTTSAASMAASLPSAPMAMPTSARLSTGASLMPSPTKASRPARASFRPAAFPPDRPCPAGSSSACTSSRPSSFATLLGHGLAVARQHDGLAHAGGFQPGDGLLCDCGLISSADDDMAAYWPSTATCMMVPSWSQGFQATPALVHQRAVARATVLPSTVAVTPWPPSSSTSVTRADLSTARLRRGAQGQR
jgi:hypothetical protein